LSVRGLLGFLLVAIAVLVWYQQRHIKATAIAAARQACNGTGATLLDETVCQTRIRLCRTNRGTLALERHFTFDYCPDGLRRERGSVLLFAGRLESVVLGAGDYD